VEDSLIQQKTVIVPPKSISDQIYEFLKENILLGKIAPGERIIESRIAEDLKTSRTPVREAFQRLVQDGLVSGYLVKKMVEDIKKKKIPLKKAAIELAKPCLCGIFNPDRAAKLLKSMAHL
jgi:DNA-binding transcriptional regulator YhcF (GntR family)